VPTATVLSVTPSSDSNPRGTNHTLTATVTDQSGAPLPGVAIVWNIDSGPGSFVSMQSTTNANGKATAVITSPSPGTTVVSAEVADNPTISDTASKTWT
jgi:hypothetical protein